jgi:hypothetical protein
MGFLERATLVVLAETAEIGLPEAIAVPVAAFDPLLRGTLRRRASAAVVRAEERTKLHAGDHVLRLAFLLVHPAAPKDLDPNDERAVSDAFEGLAAPLTPHLQKARERRATAYREAARDRAPEPAFEPAKKRPRPFWPVTTSLSAAFAVGVVALAAVFVLPYWIPSKVDRFRKTPFGQALDAPLTAAVVGARTGSMDGHDVLLSQSVTRQIGAPARAELEGLLATLPAATKSTAPVDEAMSPVFVRLNALNARLADEKVPVLLHAYSRGYAGDRSLWVTSYYVERREEITFEASSLKTAWGRRLDTLNLADSGVYKSTAEDYAILSLDVLEKSFVETVLPALVREDGVPPPDPSARTRLEVLAEREVGRELRDATHVSLGDARELSEALALRNMALQKAGRKSTPELDLGPAFRDVHDGSASEAHRLNDQMHLHRKKVDPAIAKLAEHVSEGFVVRIRDEERFETSVFPKLGVSDGSSGSRARVSSDLGVLARSSCPHLALWLVARKVLYGPSGFERLHAETALVLVLRELGVLTEPGRPTEEALVNGLIKAFETDSAKLRAAAAGAYENAFVTTVPPIQRRTL